MTHALKHIPITKEIIKEKCTKMQGYQMLRTGQKLSMERALEITLDHYNELLKKQGE